MTIEVSPNCFYLDAAGRAHGPMLEVPSEIATTTAPQFYVQARTALELLNSRWNADGRHVSRDPAFELVKEFLPAVVGSADFGVPSDAFGYVLEALDQIPALPGGPLIEDMDSEIIAFTYEQFFHVAGFFGLLKKKKTPQERINEAVIELRDEHGHESAAVSIFSGDQAEVEAFDKHQDVFSAKAKLRAEVEKGKLAKVPTPPKESFEEELIASLSKAFGISPEMLGLKRHTGGPVGIPKAFPTNIGKKPEGSLEKSVKSMQFVIDKAFLSGYGMTDVEDNCGCSVCNDRREKNGKLSPEANARRMVEDFQRRGEKLDAATGTAMHQQFDEIYARLILDGKITRATPAKEVEEIMIRAAAEHFDIPSAMVDSFLGK